MKPEPALYELIEQYLAGTLEASRRQAFEQQLQQDPDLRQEVAVHRFLQQQGADPGKMALRRQLGELSKQQQASRRKKLRQRRWAFIGLAALALTILAFWWLLHRSGETAPTPPMPPTQTAPEEAPPVETPPSQEADAPAAPSKPDNAIAALDPADWAPNPLLDPLAGSILRQDAPLALRLTSPAPERQFTLQNRKVALLIEGELAKDALDEPFEALNIQLFSNRQEDYLESRPVFTQTPACPAEGNICKFKLTPRLALKPGLYYLVIAAQDGTPLEVRRLRVQPAPEADSSH